MLRRCFRNEVESVEIDSRGALLVGVVGWGIGQSSSHQMGSPGGHDAVLLRERARDDKQKLKI